MKTKFVLLFSIGIMVSAIPSACSPSPSQPKIIPVDDSMDNGMVEASVGDQVEISLPGNMTTGYAWMVKEMDKTVLEQQAEPEYKPDSGAVGAGGKFVFRMKAIAAGETQVDLVYRRSFESEDVPPADEFKILVKVSK